MQQPSLDQFFGEITASARVLAGIAGTCDNDLPVPSCPDWTLRQLATHVGRVHRWAAEMVGTRSQELIAFTAVPDGSYPAEPAARSAWLIAGAGRVVEAIGDAGAEPVWAFGDILPASFWARRQSHETMVHRADAELASGLPVSLDRQLAADGIDEWLSNIASGRRGTRQSPLPAGARLQLDASLAAEGGGTASWLLTGTEEGFALAREPGPAETALADTRVGAGPADVLLLVLLRRLAADEPGISVSGAGGLLPGWLAGTPF